MKILDLGCGNTKKDGTVGIDCRFSPGIDIIHDLNIYPWPLESNSFDLVICNHIIEHLNDIVKTMEEIHRVLKKGGLVKICTPHFSNTMSFKDPTHKWHFTYGSFDYFLEGLKDNEASYTDVSFKPQKKQLIFTHSFLALFAKPISKFSMRFYEKNFCRLFPAKELYLEMKAIK